MFYTIYKITNLINNKIYIGKHQSKKIDDGYMGSGKHLEHAISKYGIDNFKKEIIFQFDNEDEMNLKEAELVTEEFCLREDTYNICVGGKGGFSYINKLQLGVPHFTADNASIYSHKANQRKRELFANTEWANAYKLRISESLKLNPSSGFQGKSHTDEARKRISEANSKMIGVKNSQYGTMWITNGQENKKIKKDAVIPEGWYKGRKRIKSS
jgi:hypothetical protein